MGKAVEYYSDDWAGLYLDGKLMAEGHSISIRELMEAMGHSYQIQEIEQEKMEAMGCLPENEEDIKNLIL